MERSTCSSLSGATGIGSHGGPTPSTPAAAAVHGYTTAFWWSAGIFFVGALFSGLLLRSGAQDQEREPAAAPAMVHGHRAKAGSGQRGGRLLGYAQPLVAHQEALVWSPIA
jgi:hypothetical protein